VSLLAAIASIELAIVRFADVAVPSAPPLIGKT
jgi:hypothetical protein